MLCLGCAGANGPSPQAARHPNAAGGATGAVRVQVEPAARETMVRIGDDAFALPASGALRIEIAAGTYIVSAAAPGFRVQRVAVVVSAGRDASAKLELSPEESASSGYEKKAEDRSVPERVARGAAGEAGNRTKSRVVREYRSLIDLALDKLMGR